MFHTIQALLKKPQTIIGIVTALMFQIIFSVIWMTAYDGVNERTEGLRIAIVNEDGEASQAIIQQIAAVLPFQIDTSLTAEQAQQQLNEHKAHMVMAFPSGFSEQLRSPGAHAEIQYTYNEANPVSVKSIMQGAAGKVTESVNSQATVQGIQAVLAQTGASADEAGNIALGLTGKVEAASTSIHPVDGMNNQMLPMMMVLSSYVGAMIMGMNLQQASGMLASLHSKWRRFGAATVINLCSAVGVSLLGSSLVVLLGGQAEQGFLSLWLFQALFLGTFMFFSQMFLIAFGMSGMMFNIIMLSLQLVSSGAMVPREMLNQFYSQIGTILPATYAVQGIMSVQLGGPGALQASGALVIVLLSCVALSAAATALRRESRAKTATAPELVSG
ncbi:DUF3533 domain-containing protein [Paenibacillaceae bacterium]|nr:DUF3533 domain-containing protein [Paenibacillaceae bacterium]